MLLRSATYHNVGPFKDFTFDVENLRGIVAITAPNGTGKSFSLEAALPGACYRKMPTQGKLSTRATDRDAWVETRIVYGQPYTIRQVMDGVSGATESLVLDAENEPILSDTKVTTFAAWAARQLPDNDVYLAGPFGAQQSEGFVAMSSGDRIAVILRVLGIAKLERLAKLARERESKTSTAFEALAARIADARGSDHGVTRAAEQRDDARTAADQADAALALAKTGLEARQQEAAAHAVRTVERDAAVKLRETLAEQLGAARGRLAKAAEMLANNRMIQDDAAAIRAAATGLQAANAELTRLELAMVAADTAIRAELDPWRDGAARLKAAEQRRAGALARLKDEETIRAAEAALPVLRSEVDAERVAVAALQTEWEELLAKPSAGTAERLTGLRDGLSDIAERELSDPSGRARAALHTDDAAVTDEGEAPKLRAELKTKLQAERDHLAVAERKLVDAEKSAALAAGLVTAKDDQKSAEAETTSIRSGHAAAVIAALIRALGRFEAAATIAAKGPELEQQRKLAGRLVRLEASDARIAELEPQVDAETAELAKLEAQITALLIVEPGEAPDVASASKTVTLAEEAAKALHAAAARAEQSLTRSREVDEKVAKLEEERAAAAAELADWNRLELDLGRKGIQSAEVDSAGPELTELCNDLLRRCHGTRYTISVQTQRLDGAGKKLVEECNIRVIDSAKGTEKEVREHSGGERTILAEALSLALTMLACRRAGFSDFTIVRDESGAALDPENNRAYVAMLRHALAVTGARHVLLVSHSKEVQEMCDHIIEIPAAA